MCELTLDGLAKRVADQVCEQLGNGRTGPRTARLLTVEQAAEYLGRSKGAVEHMVALGKLPRVKSDRRVFIDIRDLDVWVEDHKERAI